VLTYSTNTVTRPQSAMAYNVIERLISATDKYRVRFNPSKKELPHGNDCP